MSDSTNAPTPAPVNPPQPPPADDGTTKAGDYGALGRFGYWLVGKSYRSSTASLLGIGATVAYGIAIYPDMDIHKPQTWAPLILALVPSVGLRFTKDANVTGLPPK